MTKQSSNFRKRQLLDCFAALAMTMLLTACATVTASTDQEIHVATEPAGAACLLSNQLGSWNIEKTPATVAVQRSFSPLKISCAHEGEGPPMELTLEPHTRGRAYGNILLLGLPAYVDAGTGAGYEYRPESVVLSYPQTP